MIPGKNHPKASRSVLAVRLLGQHSSGPLRVRGAEQGGAAWAYCQAGGGHCEADWEKQVPGFMDFLLMR